MILVDINTHRDSETLRPAQVENPKALSCPLPTRLAEHNEQMTIYENPAPSRPTDRPTYIESRVIGPDFSLTISIMDPKIVDGISIQTGPANEITENYLRLQQNGVSQELLKDYYNENLREKPFQKLLRFIRIDKSQPTMTEVNLKTDMPHQVSFDQVNGIYVDKEGKVSLYGLDKSGNMQNIRLDLNHFGMGLSANISFAEDTMFIKQGSVDLARITLKDMNPASQTQLFTLFASLSSNPDRPRGIIAPENHILTDGLNLGDVRESATRLNLQTPVTIISTDNVVGLPSIINVSLPSGTPLEIHSVVNSNGQMIVLGILDPLDVPEIQAELMRNDPNFKILSLYQIQIRLENIIIDPKGIRVNKSRVILPAGPSGMIPGSEVLTAHVEPRYYGPPTTSRDLALYNNRRTKQALKTQANK